RARRRPARELPRRRGDRVELPRHALPRRLRALRGSRRTARSARTADDTDDRERLRVDGADCARRLGDRRPPSPPAAPIPLRGRLRGARGGAARLIAARSIRELDLPRHGVVGLVPTMGALHDGHLALFRAARPACDVLVASVFVNPVQFSQSEDLAAYPRNLERDSAIAEREGIDVVFAPPVEEMYPPGFATWVVPDGAAE